MGRMQRLIVLGCLGISVLGLGDSVENDNQAPGMLSTRAEIKESLLEFEAVDEKRNMKPKLVQHRRHNPAENCGVCTPLEALDPNYLVDLRMHLPDPNSHSSCKEHRKGSKDGAEFDQILQEIGTDSHHDCIQAFSPQAVENGLGATLASLMKPMLHAVKYQHCVLTPKLSMWTGKSCNGFECFFQPMVSKSKAPPLDKLQFSRKEAERCDMEGYLNETYCPTWWQFQVEQEDPPINSTESSLSDNCLFSYSYAARGNAILPDEYADRGLFFAISHVTKHMMRPSKAMVKRVAKVEKAIGWPQHAPVLALHVRQGDSCIKSRQNMQGRHCDGLAHYIPSVKLLADKYKIKHVFLATDSDTVRKETKKYPQYTWLLEKESLHSQRRSHVLKYLPIEKALRYQVVDPFEEAAEYLTDLYLTAKSHAFVGKFTSNMDRLALNYMGAQHDCLRPFISLDSGWCFDYGIANGDGDMGKFMC